MASFLSLNRHGTTAVLRFERPPANALNLAVMTELLAVLQRISQDETRALVLSGQGRFFSAGLDLFEVFAYPKAEAEAFVQAFDDAMTALFALRIPVVAAINGHAIAGGAVLAAAADFRLMSDSGGKFGITEIHVGVPFPTSALEIIRYAFQGPYLAELLYRGQNYEVGAALSRRLVDELHSADTLLDRALQLAAELGAHPQTAFATTKEGLRREALLRMTKARANGPDPLWAKWQSPEVLAVVNAYREATLRKKSTAPAK